MSCSSRSPRPCRRRSGRSKTRCRQDATPGVVARVHSVRRLVAVREPMATRRAVSVAVVPPLWRRPSTCSRRTTAGSRTGNGLLALRQGWIAVERLVLLRVVEPERREDARLEHRCGFRSSDRGSIGVPPVGDVSNGSPGVRADVTGRATSGRRDCACRPPSCPTNVRWTGSVLLYSQGLLPGRQRCRVR